MTDEEQHTRQIAILLSQSPRKVHISVVVTNPSRNPAIPTSYPLRCLSQPQQFSSPSTRICNRNLSIPPYNCIAEKIKEGSELQTLLTARMTSVIVGRQDGTRAPA